ncbi:ribosomal protein S18-alanine N-acetyltransferase [Secundilactobacillus collinoides]|uniref:N-acetyltransferase domain-containing protein n=2 Tax=Secundilactobacillus collinoides TaxID=33960 RepID=A0A0R2B8Q9_SECCO|nr:ribosomal protein S18-alanine N-acetyltransferase [Secundilactobacillus collinoides]KRM75440.1 hypothetical protein FC82_GL002311 [Secundilactobacillus collinoides DSM 20515 = JCM 1123]KZL41566.1 hypothetical protein TY91_06055 [Secundilactobacillus collinoides]
MTNAQTQVISAPKLGQMPDLAKRCAAIAQAAYPKDAAWSQAVFAQDLTTEKRVYALTYYEGRLVGYLGAIKVLDQVDITGIAIHPELQRRGLAFKLMAAFLATLESATEVFLEVRVSNVPAQGLYRKLGFKKIGVRPEYYTHPVEDALLMKAVISGD